MEFFEDDFIDDSDDSDENPGLDGDGEEDSDAEEDQPAAAKEEEEAAEEEDQEDGQLPADVAHDIADVFAATEKMESLSMSLKRSIKMSNPETTQLYSLLFCVFRDTELILTRNRTAVPFSLQGECNKSKELSLENGVITHKVFTEGFDAGSADGKTGGQVTAFLEMRRDIAERGLPRVVTVASDLLKDPLVRSHNTLRMTKQKINDLKKANKELALRTRQTANRLVRIEKQGKDMERLGATDKSDVIIQQQRLQRVLTRVHNLRDGNETVTTENTDLQKRLSSEGARVKRDEAVSPRVSALRKQVSELVAHCEQSEEERETAMAQRRVSMTRMNDAVMKLESDIARIERMQESVNNKHRIMTQGQKDGDGDTKKLRDVKKAPGSRIPVFNREKAGK